MGKGNYLIIFFYRWVLNLYNKKAEAPKGIEADHFLACPLSGLFFVFVFFFLFCFVVSFVFCFFSLLFSPFLPFF